MKNLYALFLAMVICLSASATIDTVGNMGLTFDPATITITEGDTVFWDIEPTHNVVEVDLVTYTANGNTGNGGFSTPFGGGSVPFATVGTYYYVCQPHAGFAMKGIVEVQAAPPMLAQMDLPVTFDDPTVNYATIDFGGTASSFAADPDDPSNMVVQTEKMVGANFWAGTTLAVEGTPPGAPNDLAFASAIPFTATETRLSVRVYAHAAGIPVMLKVEDQLNGGIFVEALDTTTVAGAWDTLYFDFATPTNGVLDLANTYDKASLFYHFDVTAGAGTGQLFYWDDVMFNPGPPAPLSQMDLPVTFDDPTVNYATIDFAGTVSSFTADPADPSNMVVQTEKTTGAAFFAGTTLAVEGTPPGTPNDLAFASAIPFTATETRLSVRVWAHATGIPVMLKVEDQLFGGTFVEAQDTTAVTGAWDTLYFDFAAPTNGVLNIANTYDKVTLFYHFDVAAGAGTGQLFYWDDVMFNPEPVMLTQMDLPVTFDDPTVGYETIDFGGTVSTFITDPSDPANMVVQTEKTAGAAFWAGTTLAVEGTPPGAPNDLAFASAIPFTASETTMSIRVWAHATGIPVMLKVEDQLNGGIFVEAQDTTTVAGAWETLLFDFSTPTNGTLNLANTYDKVSLFYHFEDPAGVGAGQTFLWDDVEFVPGAPASVQMDLPVTFDDPTVNYATIDFGGTASSFAADPDDPSNMVVQTEKMVGANFWAGTTLAVEGTPPGAPNDLAFASAIPFTATETRLSVRVYAHAVGIPVMLKVEDQLNGGIFVEAQDTTTVAGAWDTLYFDFGTPTNGSINLANTYDKASLFYHFNDPAGVGAGQLFYWDDVMFNPEPVILTQMDLPVTFDDPTVEYATIDFGGTVSTFAADPTDPANMVVQTEKTAGAQFWAGTTLAVEGTPPGAPNDTGFSNPIPFTATETTISVSVYAHAAGIPVMLKVEDQLNGGIFVEAQDTTTVAGAWDTLEFDFGMPTAGAINLANTYDKVSLFYHFNDPAGVGTGQIFYWDDVIFGIPAPTLAQMDLPVTFDDPTVEYATIDFGGTASSFAVDPDDPTNMVVQTEKTAGAQFWAGTTLAVEGTPPGAPNDLAFANPIPFTATETRLSVRVYAHAVGIPVMLKVEDQLNGGIFVEALDTTTIAGAWDTLYFDFGTPTNGSINLANTYDKASLFYHFNDPAGVGVGQIFYWDDVMFNPEPSTPPMIGLSPYCEEPTFHFGGDLPSEILLTIANVDPTTMIVEIESADADAVDFLNVLNGSGATISGEDFSVPNRISRTLTWAVPPSTVDLNLLWSKASFGGNWQLGTSDITVNFADTCGAGSPPTLFQMDLPVTFDDPTVNYATIDFGGTASTFAVDPADSTNMVVQTEKTAGAQFWAGTTLAVEGTPPGAPNDLAFANPIPFTATDTRLSVRVYAHAVGIPVMLKVEDQLNGGIFVEAQDTTTVAMAWDTLYFDFANATNGSLNLANTYDKASLFYHFEDPAGAGVGQIFYWDDVMFNPEPTTPPMTGLSPYCEEPTFHFGGDLPSEILLTIANVDPTTMIVEIESADADAVDFLNVLNGSGATISGEDFSVPNRISRTLTWTVPPSTVDLNLLWSKASFGGNWQLSATDITVNFTDTCGPGSPPTLLQMDLPVTFDDPTVNYATIDFGGTASTFAVDPADPTNMVVQTEKTAGAFFWAGTTLAVEGTPTPGSPNDLGFANAIPFTATDTRLSVRVYAHAVGIPVMLKVENQVNNGMFVEAQDTTTVAGAWDTLYFDFANATNGSLNLANTYDKASLFYHFEDPAGAGVGQIFYWDDVMFNPIPGPTLDQMDLPVTFDDAMVEYATIDFGGTASTFAADPTDPSNMVVQTEKTLGAQFWAGTTLAVEGTPPGAPNDVAFANPIPFTATDARLSVRLYAPAAGIPVMLKVEDQLNPGIFVETQTTTSVANAWETLYFDFNSPTNGALNLMNTYDKASLFYNFDVANGAGQGEIFYWDDVQFDPIVLSVNDAVCGAIAMPAASTHGGYSTYNFFGSLVCRTVTGNNEMSSLGSEVAQACGTGGKSLWYSFTTPSCDDAGNSPFDVVVSTDNVGTTFNTLLDVFSSSDGTCSGALTSIGCNEDASGEAGCSGTGVGTGSTVTASGLLPNTSYFVRVDGVNGAFGDFELSVSIVPEAPVLSNPVASSLQIDAANTGSYLYTYYTRIVGNAGYSVNSSSSNTYSKTISTGNDYEVQVLHRCSPTEHFRSEVATINIPAVDACTPINDLVCGESTETTLTVSFGEKTGLYMGAGGNLSGYIIYWNEVGTPGYSVISNPSPSCVGGVCTYTITNNIVEGATYEVWLRSRCGPGVAPISNVIQCTAEGMSRPSEPITVSFQLDDTEYVDVRISDDWNDFGLDIPSNFNGYLDFSDGTLQVLDKEGGNPISLAGNEDVLEVALMPNPTKNQTTIVLSEYAANTTYEIVSLQGQRVHFGAFENGSNSVLVETTDLNTGIYLVNVVSKGITATQKLVILK